MTIRALIVDDTREIVRTVGDIVKSHGHVYDSAGDQEGALKLLQAGQYAYLVLDLDIPVGPRRLSRPENGRNLLTQVRRTPGLERTPVIVITGRDEGDVDFAVGVMKDGVGGWTDYVRKPIKGDRLDKAIKDALAHREKKDGTAAASAEAKPKVLERFDAAKREMVIYEDRVTICGVEVWQATYQSDMREVLVRLSKKEGGGYVRISGPKLMKELGRDVSNPIGRPIKSFCDTARRLLTEERNLACGRYDIIASKRGYHFTDWMDVREAGSEKDEPAKPAHEPAGEPDEPGREPDVNDRQKWILAQLEEGVQLRLADIVRHTKANRSTINRDLKDLREWGLLATDPDGYYVRARPDRAAHEP